MSLKCRNIVHDLFAQTRKIYGRKGEIAHIENPPPSRIGDQRPRPREGCYLSPNQADSDSHCAEQSWSHYGSVHSPEPSIDAGSMAPTGNELRTGNSNMSEGQQQPPENDGVLKENKLSPTEPFRSTYHVDDNPIAPDVPVEPTATSPIFNEGTATPNPICSGRFEGQGRSYEESLPPQTITDQAIKGLNSEQSTISTGPLHSAPRRGRISEDGTAVEEVVDETKSTTSGTPTAKLQSEEDYDIILSEDMDGFDDYGNKSLDADCLEGGYMIIIPLIPYSLSPVELPKVLTTPSKKEMQRVEKQRLDVQRRRREIQKLKSSLEAKEKQFFDENEEAFKRLGEFVIEGHRRNKTHDSSLKMASKLFISCRSSRDECGPLINEISSLQDTLVSEETELSDAEKSLHERLLIPPVGSDESQMNGIAIPEIAISHSPSTLETKYNSADNARNVNGEDSGLDDDAYSTDSFEKYRKDYHPIYVEYQERRGAQENLNEKRDSVMAEMDRLEEQHQTRRRLGLTLLKDDQRLLDSLPGAIRLLDTEIEESQVKIEKLKEQCLEEGIMDEDDNYIDGDREDSEGSDYSDYSDESMPPRPPPPPPPSAPPKPHVPMLLPPQNHISPNAPSSTARSIILSNLGTRLDDRSYQARINPWLLGKLADSRAELTLLATILSAMDAQPDGATLQDVFKLWDHDGAGIEAPERPGDLDDATVNKLRRAAKFVKGNGFDRALVSSLFGLSLWGGEAYGGSGETAYLDDI